MQGTAADYARARGISQAAVSKLISKGKIARDPAGIIDFVAADRARNDSRVRAVLADEAPEPPQPMPAGSGALAGGEAAPSGLNRAALVEKTYRAKLLQLELEERQGLLIPKEGVLMGATEAGRAVARDLRGILNWAEDIAAAATVGGVGAVRAVLQERIHAIQARLTKHVAMIARRGEEDEDEEAADVAD